MRYPLFVSLTCVLLAPLLAPAAPPNVVLIVGDDQGWTDYGFTGHPHIKTPNLDRLAADSLVFKRGYVPTSLCRASLATVVTGRYPHRHKITSNDPPLPTGKLLGQAMKDPAFLALRAEMAAYIEKVPTLPRLLAAKGYVSHQSGKWWEADSCRCGGFTAGMTHGDPARGGRHGDAGLKIGREGLMPVTAFIDQAKADGKPFFVWYAPMMPHTPHTPPDRLLAKYKGKTPSPFVAKYWAMCEWFDETVGDLLAHLAKRGLADSTLVVYLHDNGWIQDPESNQFAPKSKRSPYDGGLRTPILVRWPGTVRPAESDALASSIDLAPTILHAAGLTSPADLPGVNLLDPAAVRKRDAVFGATFAHNAIDIHRPAENLEYRWTISGNWKLILPNPAIVRTGRPELYDLSNDPKEEKNQAENQPRVVTELQDRLDKWWKPE
jgi:uncharacterized sulfatase